MSAALTQLECEIVQRLVDKGFHRPSAALAVVMTTREHSRPEAELVHIVRQYQWLESPKDAQDAIHHLKQLGWLKEFTTYEATLLRQSGSLRKRIAEELKDDSIKETLKQIRSAVDPFVSVLGSMNDEEVYRSYLRLLETAHSEICLPMLATTPNLESVPTLQDRAGNGVKVRIILASPSVVAQLRGEGMRKMATEAIQGWKAHAASYPNMEVRVTDTLSDAYLSTCMLIDRKLLRFDVYDPHEQRSLQGEMVEFRSPEGLELNMIRLFHSQFEAAWARARPVGSRAYVIWWLRRNWNWWMALLFAIAAIKAHADPVLSGILGSSSATFLTTGLVELWARGINKR